MDLLGLFAGSGAITGGANIIIKLMMAIGGWIKEGHQNNLDQAEKRMELEERRNVLETGNSYILAAAIISRGYMLVVSTSMLIFATVFSALHPDVIVYYPMENIWDFSILGFTIAEGSGAITWQKLQGFIILPIWMVIMGAEVSFRYTNAMFTKR